MNDCLTCKNCGTCLMQAVGEQAMCPLINKMLEL